VSHPRLRDAGDSMLLLEFEPVVDVTVNARAIGTAAAVRERSLPGLRDVRATLRSVAVEYDPLVIDRGEVADALMRAAADAVPRQGREIDIPAVYGGDAGPDLAEVAARSAMREADVVAAHADRWYHAFMIGFVPGFPYLGPVSDRIDAPRRATPRLRVPAGTVGIAGRQTGIYPRTSPGGWALVGRTNVRLFDPDRTPPALVQPGDRVRFVPVEHLDFDEINAGRAATEHELPAVLVVTAPGLLTSVQDAGRWGSQTSGVTVGGALDRSALAAANRAVGNDPTAAVLEATLPGLELLANQSCVMAVAGADLGATIDGRPLPMMAAIEVPAGSTVRLTARRSGTRAYIAVAGGIDVPAVLGSRATDLGAGFGGLDGRPLKTGDRLAVGRPHGPAPAPTHGRGGGVAIGSGPGGARLRVLWGPHDDRLRPEARGDLVRTRFTVTPQSNRMAYRLHGTTPLRHRDVGEMISDATVTGGIQVPPDGQPILLMADRQVTGGYPLLATVITADLPLAAQLAPGDWVEFEPCSRDLAVSALRHGAGA